MGNIAIPNDQALRFSFKERPMINPTPDVSCKYGAPMGRYTGVDYIEVNAGPLYLRHIPLDSGGYDKGGAYWGHYQRLYYVEDQDGNSHFFRAYNRADAKATIVDKWPGAKFYN